MISYQDISLIKKEHLPNWIVTFCIILSALILCLFLIIRLIPYEEGITIEGISISDEVIYTVIPSREEEILKKCSTFRIINKTYQVAKLEFLNQEEVNGTFYTEVNIYLQSKTNLELNHYYEVKAIITKTTWWNRFKEYIKEVFN